MTFNSLYLKDPHLKCSKTFTLWNFLLQTPNTAKRTDPERYKMLAQAPTVTDQLIKHWKSVNHTCNICDSTWRIHKKPRASSNRWKDLHEQKLEIRHLTNRDCATPRHQMLSTPPSWMSIMLIFYHIICSKYTRDTMTDIKKANSQIFINLIAGHAKLMSLYLPILITNSQRCIANWFLICDSTCT